MKRIVCALATSAVAVTLMAGTAAAEGVDESWTPPKCEEPAWEPELEGEIVDRYSDGEYLDEYPLDCEDGGQYPPAPKQVYVPVPTIDAGSYLMAKGKGLCPGIPAVFAVQSNADWTQRVFSPEQYVAEDGTSWYKFSASELAGLYGPVTVYVKQGGKCEGSATTSATINKKPAPEPTKDDGTSRPDGSGGMIPDPAPTTPAAPVPAVVLSGGVSAPATPVAPVTPVVSSGTTQAAPAQAALPATGSTTDGLLQMALVALATGLGMVYVTTRRRQAIQATNR